MTNTTLEWPIAMSDTDALHRFLFEGTEVRGELVHLDASWRAVLARHPYPNTVRGPLGEALAATVLLTGTLKFDGALILQIQGEGPLRTLVTQATQGRTIRGLARWEGEVPEGAIEAIFGAGRLVLTLEPEGGERYQGIVPLFGANLAEALETYFRTSEQIGTRLWLAAGPQRAAGLLLQRLPGSCGAEEDWTRVVTLAETLTPRELTALPAQRLLHRLFHEEDLRLFDAEPVAFRCTCSRGRVEQTLRTLGQAEVESMLEEQGQVEVGCEFCNRTYRWDLVDARQLFSAATRHDMPPARH
jgi:molecular chaperone Hsp33